MVLAMEQLGFGLQGKKALIMGVANNRSLGWAIAQKLHQAGAELAFSYLDDRFKKRLEPLAAEVHTAFLAPCDVQKEGEIDALFAEVQRRWGKLDVLVHSLAYANQEDLDGRFIDTSKNGFQLALDISAYSLIAVARAAEPLMKDDGGSIVTLTYNGSQRVMPNYNVMGVAKAALESSVRYLSYDLGVNKIRINAISAGPVRTLAASGVKDFKSILDVIEQKSPLKENITAEDVGNLGVFFASPLSGHITGTVTFVDSGAHIMGN